MTFSAPAATEYVYRYVAPHDHDMWKPFWEPIVVAKKTARFLFVVRSGGYEDIDLHGSTIYIPARYWRLEREELERSGSVWCAGARDRYFSAEEKLAAEKARRHAEAEDRCRIMKSKTESDDDWKPLQKRCAETGHVYEPDGNEFICTFCRAVTAPEHLNADRTERPLFAVIEAPDV